MAKTIFKKFLNTPSCQGELLLPTPLYTRACSPAQNFILF